MSSVSSKRDQDLFTILSSDPNSVFRKIKSSKRSHPKVHTLQVGPKTYTGESVSDGFYDSVSNLKTVHSMSTPSSDDFFLDYKYIMNICSKATLPPITYQQAKDILFKIRPCVSDLFSITAYHYLHAGQVGLDHFYLLLSCLICDINTISLAEVSTVHAIVLFKGHGKSRSSDRSYRTISTCPLVAKALDLYLRELNLDAWNADLSDVQFLGQGSSHELAGVLFTECIQHSFYTNMKPLFALYLDAKSAFDNVLRQLLIRNLFLCGTSPASVLFINSRLKNRKTILEWDKHHMGPINDQKGVEQGGPNSGEYYKVFGKPQLDLAQRSGLGITLPGNISVSAVGQADDTILISDSLYALQNLLQLTIHFCKKYGVELCVEKTKLQAFTPTSHQATVEHQKIISPVNIDGESLKFVNNSMQGAEHVGIVRSSSGNLPHILNRFTAHQKSMAAVLHTGIGRHHRGNPTASLRIQQVYGTPVLLSGLGSLVLSKVELDMIDKHYHSTLQNLMRLHNKTPHCVTFFLAGSLPGIALVHLRILSNFGMITRNPNSILYRLGLEIYAYGKLPPKSWFAQVRNICHLYQLPHPILLMQQPLSKLSFKALVKKTVVQYWEEKFRLDASELPSLKYFCPANMSLTSAHPVWLSASSSSYEVSKATVQAKMLSGRYRTELLSSHWSDNPNGWCLTPECLGNQVTEDLDHILASCPSLAHQRRNLQVFTLQFAKNNPTVQPILSTYCSPDHPMFCQFLLDCSCLPEVHTLVITNGSICLDMLLYVGRTWCYTLHRERARLLNKWKF